MSIFDYEQSQVIDLESHRREWPFYAMVMACMRRADTDNAERLRRAFPEVRAELEARYRAPGGLLPGEACAECQGNAVIYCQRSGNATNTPSEPIRCPHCEGTGRAVAPPQELKCHT